jgi:hypothetical protein
MRPRRSGADAGLVRVLAAILSVFAVVGCAGGLEAREAQQLLQRAQAEQQKLRSAGFSVELSINADGQKFAVTMDGAAATKGRSAGDMYMRMRATGMGGEPFAMSVAKRGHRVTITAQGQTQTLPAGDERAPKLDSLGSLGSFDFSSCIDDIDVAGGRQLNGEPATRVAGSVDIVCVVKAATALSGAAGGAAPFDLSKFSENMERELAKYLDVVRATLYVSERTHLLIGALLRTTVRAEGKFADIQLTYRLTRVNQPLRFPAGL